MQNCARRNPLNRSGLTSDGRQRPQLGREHFLPDERDLADLVQFGSRYARHIRYYDAHNREDGDWLAFFDSDVTATLASLSKLPLDTFRDFQADLEAWLRLAETEDDATLSAHMKLVFHVPLAMLSAVVTPFGRLPADHPLHGVITRLFARDLVVPLQALVSWYKGALDIDGGGDQLFDDSAPSLADYNTAGTAGDTRVRLVATVSAALDGRAALSADATLSAVVFAGSAFADWNALYAAAVADPSPYVDASSHYERIYDALSYNLLSTAVERIYQGLQRVRDAAAEHLQASLTEFGRHAPNYGLWLAFLQLFRHAQQELNRFTGRHLDFYFKEVLQLRHRAPVPDRVHVLLQLAKGYDVHRLTAGTAFRAGKDDSGKPLRYTLENDIVVNRASIAELRGVRLESAAAATGQTLLPRAASVVDSRDGLGEVELADDDPAFAAFGPPSTPPARVGFAIADRKLFLREGNRTIVVRVELKRPVTDTAIAPRWRVRLSAEEGWFEPAAGQVTTVLDNDFAEKDVVSRAPAGKYQATGKGPASMAGSRGGKGAPIDAYSGETSKGGKDDDLLARFGRRGKGDAGKPGRQRRVPVLEITIRLAPGDPAIIPVDSELHGDEHAPGVAVCELAFDFAQAASARAYAVLADVTFDHVTLQVTAAQLKNLAVIADGSVVDTAKPFAPFGARPRAGALLHIGSSEIFSKAIASWRLRVDWADTYSKTGYFRNVAADVYNPLEWILSDGEWKLVDPPETIEKKGFSMSTVAARTNIGIGESTALIALRSGKYIDGLTTQTIDNPTLEAGTLNGFIRMPLPSDFGHDAYPTEHARAMVAIATNGVSYNPASGVNIYDADPQAGKAELPRLPYEPLITRIEADYQTTRDDVTALNLLHPFGSSAVSGARLFPDLADAGALYIGLDDFDGAARLTLLAQVLDGSGDPLVPVPDLTFAALDGDSWQTLEAQDVDDKSLNLTTSGVIGLNLPERRDRDHHVLPAGNYWVRIAAARDADALNRLLSLDTQAARMVFADDDNDPGYLDSPLPAQSIAKLAVPDTAIKSIVQPYASFGGRAGEAAPAFDTRVSERLRHKDRAVSPWDYEALVLEAFPSLYRAKCLPTTELMRDGNQRILADNEVMPGAVTVVTVPWTHGQNHRNPLRPYTDQATLTAVDTFLRARVSPFVRLEVSNPHFEEIHLDFKVRFRAGIGDIAFYTDELNKALVAFLSPWSQAQGNDIVFGGQVWKSSVIDFVDEWPHVDFVTDFRMYHKVDVDAPETAWTPVDVERISATSARSILVSAAGHRIVEVAR